jgi:sec-independent protein translocase protein TatA
MKIEDILIILLVAAVLIFGPKNLPKLGTMFGKTIRNVRAGVEGKDDESPIIEAEDEEAEVIKPKGEV